MSNSITWKIGGEAGFGIMTVGEMFSKTAIRSGFYIFDHIEYPSLIRGGHNVIDVRFSANEVFCQEYGVDLLIALNRETIDLHRQELKPKSGIMYDPDKVKVEQSEVSANTTLLPVPFSKLIKESGVSPVMQNNIALAASCAFLNFDLTNLFTVIESVFAKKGEKIITDNKKSAQLGYDYVLNNLKSKFNLALTPNPSLKLMATTGNEAIGLGAIAAGCQFYSAYPMTPTSNLLSFLAEKAEETGMVVKHAEDEISVINMAIGASFAGVRSMVGTAGGGFSLMVEGLGLAGITETPIVIAMGQRPGPATGMPTWTGQGDLQFLIHASQDEFPRIILAPGDVEEAFYLTAEAFNLADIYQTPVFVLCDLYLCECRKSSPIFDTNKIKIERGKIINSDQGANLTNYKRYLATEDGISPRVIPGTKGTYFLANSYEHEESGLSTEDGNERVKQVEKRNRKLITYQNIMPKVAIYGMSEADITLVGWGTTKGPVLQALSDLNYNHKGRTVNFIHLNRVWPLNNKDLLEVFAKSKRRIMIEGNSYGQMGHLIREQTGIVMDEYLLKYNGRPFYAEDIIKKLDSIV